MTVTYFVMFNGKTICRPSVEVPDNATKQEIEDALEKDMSRRFKVEYIDPLYDERTVL